MREAALAGKVVVQGDPAGEHTRWEYDAQAGCWRVTVALKQAKAHGWLVQQTGGQNGAQVLRLYKP